MTGNEKARTGGGLSQNFDGMSIPRGISSVITSETLNFARKVHHANPYQSTAAIFAFERAAWKEMVDDAVSEAELFYLLEGGKSE